MSPQNDQTPPIKLVDTRDIGPGVFSNTVNVSVTPGEVFLDFGLIAPNTSLFGEEGGALVSRVVLTKQHALNLAEVIRRTIEEDGTADDL